MWDDGKADASAAAAAAALNPDNMAVPTPAEVESVASGIHTLGLGSSRLAARAVANAETRGRGQGRERETQPGTPAQAHEAGPQAQADTSTPDAPATAAAAGPRLEDGPLEQPREGGAAEPAGRDGQTGSHASWFIRRTGRSRSPPRSGSTTPPKEAVEGGPSGTVYPKGYNDDELWTGTTTPFPLRSRAG